MKYNRPPYRAPGVPVERKKLMMFSSFEMDVPKFDYPVTPVENFKLAAARKTPYWMPISMTDEQAIMPQELVTGNVRGMQSSADFSRDNTESYTFMDWFNTSWTWVPAAGGPMLTPGTCLCNDITQWERLVQFPNLKEWDFKTSADRFMKTQYDPTKVLHINLGQGATERLISVVGGYTAGMLALALEPDAVRSFLNRFADFTIAYFDVIRSLYPVTMVTYHDDWGTEKDTFFSEKMMEEIVLEPTRRIIEHIKATGTLFEFHCCGNMTRFMPYMLDLKVDFLQIQRRTVDIPVMKKKFGYKIGFNVPIEDMAPGESDTKDELILRIRRTIDLYGKNGGAYLSLFEFDPERIWTIFSETYAYSREFYDNERNI